MEQFAIFKNQQQIGFPFNSFNHALTMLNSIKEFITDESEYDYQINDIDDHTFVVTTNSITNKHSVNNSYLLNDNNYYEDEDDNENNSFTLTIKSFKL